MACVLVGLVVELLQPQAQAGGGSVAATGVGTDNSADDLAAAIKNRAFIFSFSLEPAALLCDYALFDSEGYSNAVCFTALSFLRSCQHLVGSGVVEAFLVGKLFYGFALFIEPGLCLCWSTGRVHDSKPFKSVQLATECHSCEWCKRDYLFK